MAVNAQFRVTYQDLTVPYHSVRSLYLSSTDLASPRKAHARARATAKARLTKKGLRVKVLSSECIG